MTVLGGSGFPEDKLMEAVQSGNEAREILHGLEPELEAMKDVVFKQVMYKIQAKNLSENEAYNAWMEIAAVEKLRHRLSQRDKSGQGAGVKLKQVLD